MILSLFSVEEDYAAILHRRHHLGQRAERRCQFHAGIIVVMAADPKHAVRATRQTSIYLSGRTPPVGADDNDDNGLGLMPILRWRARDGGRRDSELKDGELTDTNNGHGSIAWVSAANDAEVKNGELEDADDGDIEVGSPTVRH
jgi:hypothetical protein